jgi:tetratricopeptide (TPR) repeat protein
VAKQSLSSLLQLPVFWSITGGVWCFITLLAYRKWPEQIAWTLFSGYLGIIVSVVAGMKMWIYRIDNRSDLDAAGKEQNRNAVLVGSTFFGSILTALLIVCIATVYVFQKGTATALFWGIGALLSGSFIGFLFSLPKVKENEKEPAPGVLQVNTSLNQIADWLTKIIVGVSLVNASKVYDYFLRATKLLGAGLNQVQDSKPDPPPAEQAFAAGLIVTFFFMGLLGTYLLTRLWISAALARADQTAFGVFVAAEVDDRDLVILESETRSFLEGERGLSAAADEVARRIEKMNLSDLHTWREFAAWGKAKSALQKHEEAIEGYKKAVQRYPESPSLRLDFAVTLFLAAGAARDGDQVAQAGLEGEKSLWKQQNEQLREGYERLNAKTAAEVRKNIYKSLTYSWLYTKPPNFTEVICYGEEYVNNPRFLPSGGIWVNLACGYAQKARWLSEESGSSEPDAKLRQSVINAIEQALRLDKTWSLRFQLLLRSDHSLKIGPNANQLYKDEDDLEIFENDAQIRLLVGLPEKRSKVAEPPTDIGK